MTQLAIDFSAPLARRTDPATSHDAAERAREFAASHEARILGWLHGSDGLTYREIATLARMEPVAVGRRLKAMEEKGVVKRESLGWKQGKRGMVPVYVERDGMNVWWPACT